MTCGEILESLQKEMPLSLAADWDNPGLLVGDPDKEVGKAVVSLDATSDVISLAVREGADLILTHHPLLFSPVQRILYTDVVGKRILRMAEHHISCMAMHTNYDIAPGCMGDLAAERLGIGGEPLEVTGEWNGKKVGIGRVGDLAQETTLEELAALIKSKFGLPFLTVYGRPLIKRKIRRIAICPGSGRHMYPLAKAAGADVLITGDITHHEGIDAAEDGITVLNAGHYGLEHIFTEDMANRLSGFESGIVVIRRKVLFPEEEL